MNIAYILWVERLDSPIIKNQVIDILNEIGNNYKEFNIYFIAFQPFYRNFIHHHEYNALKSNLLRNNVHLKIINCFSLPNVDWFNAKWYIIPIIFIQIFPILLHLIYKKKINIIHCRSYPSMLSSFVLNKIYPNLKVIFDPRSPFPEENITSGRWTNSSISYKTWKILEKIYLKYSDITVAITNSYIEHFNKIYSQSDFVVIPNNVDTTKFMPNEECRKNLRSKMGVEDNEIIFMYSGSLGNHWNNPYVYAKFIISLRKLNMKHRFLFLTPNTKEVKKIFYQYNIKDTEYFAISVDLTDMPKYLSMADFGLNLMERKDIRMSIKTCEYLAMGLPIIVNSNVLGAKEIIEQNNIGLVITNLTNINLEEIRLFIQKNNSKNSKCRDIACKKFSTNEIAKKYISTYKSLRTNDKNNACCIYKSNNKNSNG